MYSFIFYLFYFILFYLLEERAGMGGEKGERNTKSSYAYVDKHI